ncbi:hypothetical protein [Trichothermofontia sp.]
MEMSGRDWLPMMGELAFTFDAKCQSQCQSQLIADATAGIAVLAI